MAPDGPSCADILSDASPQDLEAKLRARDQKATKLAEALVAEVLA